MMSVEMKRVHVVAEGIDKTLRSDDKRMQHSVVILHEEGTTLFFRNAFIMQYHDPQHGDWGASEHPGEWIMVFTEHHGFYVYPIDDLNWFQEFQTVNSKRFPQDKEIDFCNCGKDIVYDEKEHAEFCQTCSKEIFGTRHPK